MTKKNPQSVTEVICKCDFWDQALQDPGFNPIAFDPIIQEFCIEYESHDGNKRLMIYHCPACGGRTPESLRNEPPSLLTESLIKQSRKAQLYLEKWAEEEERLCQLTADIYTIEDALKILGKPDEEFQHQFNRGDKSVNYRMLRYANLSEFIVVIIGENIKQVGITFFKTYPANP